MLNVCRIKEKYKGLLKNSRYSLTYLASIQVRLLDSSACSNTVSRSFNPQMPEIESPKQPYKVAKRLVAMVLVSVSFAFAGCIRKRMTVRSNPPGANVYIDKQPIAGQTPVSTNFTYYGTRSIEIVRDGYRTERFLRKFNPPWYAIPPLDFFSETLWPFEKRDERIIDVQLSPEPIVPREALVASGEQLRLQASQGIAVSAPPTVTTPLPILNPPAFNGQPSGLGPMNANPPILGPVGP